MEPLPLLNESAVSSTPRRGLGDIFKAVLESLVTSQSRHVDETGPLMFRYPPI
jgi:hypothetical protein